MRAPLRDEVGDGFLPSRGLAVGDRIAEEWVLGPRLARTPLADVHHGRAVASGTLVTIELLRPGQ